MKQISFLIVILITCSCSKIKTKGEQLVTDTVSKTEESVGKIKDKAKQKSFEVAAVVLDHVENQTQKVIDRVFPPFDSDTCDTENNKVRFNDFILSPVPQDVIEIYAFDDAIGADFDYSFSFKSDSSTFKKIIKEHKMQLDSLNFDNGFGLQHDFKWWDKNHIETLSKYRFDKDRYHEYLWYDGTNRQTYFFVFSL